MDILRDSSHWMANCHKSCKMSFAITMTGLRKPRGSNNLATSKSMTRFDTMWASVLSLQRNWNVSWHCMPRIHESSKLSLIMTGIWSRLSIFNSSGQFEAHLLNSNAPNASSWIVSSRISFNYRRLYRRLYPLWWACHRHKNPEERRLNRELMSVLLSQMLKAPGG